MQRRCLSEAKKKYLVKMVEMDPEGKGIRSIKIAKELDVTRPSVHAMLTRLSDDGLLVKEHYGIVYLTQEGVWQQVKKSLLPTTITVNSVMVFLNFKS